MYVGIRARILDLDLYIPGLTHLNLCDRQCNEMGGRSELKRVVGAKLTI